MTIPLHRIRFYDHTPSPITAIQYSPLPLPAPSSTPSQTPPAHPGECVIARENGHIEIWKHVSDKQTDSYGNWVLYKVGLVHSSTLVANLFADTAPNSYPSYHRATCSSHP